MKRRAFLIRMAAAAVASPAFAQSKADEDRRHRLGPDRLDDRRRCG